MAGTRSRSGAKATSPNTSTPPKPANTASKKRGAPTDSSAEAPKRKRGRPSKASKALEATQKKEEAKEQKTLEETLTDGATNGEAANGEEKDEEANANGANGADGGEKMTGVETNGNVEEEAKEQTNGHAEAESSNKKDEEKPTPANGEEKSAEKTNGTTSEDAKPQETEEPAKEKNAFDEVKSDEADAHKSAEKEQDTKNEEIKANNDSVVEDSAREAAIPSSILEKGIIYFFFRARVNIDEPQGIEDVARSYIVLRPIPLGAKIGDGPLQDDGKARLLALPKKMLPKSRNDRFLMFVEKQGLTIKDLREQFSGTEYATKTVGTSQTPSATPFAEGVYAITSTGRESHLAYTVTVPKEIGEIQKELGINTKGSFVCSVKNPEAPGPANATIDNPAKYPKELQAKFRGLRWTPLDPELLDYEGTQFLVIGEGVDGGFGKAVDEVKKDAKDETKEKPEEELEKLEEEDHDRVEGLKENDPVFADLGLSSKEYSHLETTW